MIEGMCSARIRRVGASLHQGAKQFLREGRHDFFCSGIISDVNERARRAGVEIGISVREAALKMSVEAKKAQEDVYHEKD